MQTIDQRFFVTPKIVKQSVNATAIASATATQITGMKYVLHPGQITAGLTFKFTIAGAQTGTNAAHTIVLVINGTTVQTLTAQAATAVDFMAEIILVFTGAATQNIIGVHHLETEDAHVSYDAGTVNCQAGATIQLMATSHASDSLAVNIGIIEMWDAAPLATS